MKKVFKTAALGITLAALASVASATDYELNIYGASAQFTFWGQGQAELFVRSQSSGAINVANASLKGGLGCQKAGTNFTGDFGVTVGTNCQALPNPADRVVIRYTKDNSIEGVRAAVGLNPSNKSSVCGDTAKRKLGTFTATESGTTTLSVTAVNPGATSTADCYVVDVGASDVAMTSFTQTTKPATGTPTVLRGINSLNGITPLNTQQINTFNALEVAKPVIVPFSFFANKALVRVDADTQAPKLDSNGQPIGIDNLSRQQVLMIFGAPTNLYTWDQFGPDYPAKTVARCVRTAGSGTHATLEKAVMRGSNINLIQQELIDVEDTFMKLVPGSTEMLACVNDNAGFPNDAIAVGYADSDYIMASYQLNGDENIKTANAQVKRMNYNGGGEGMTAANYETYGYSGVKNDIINGSYEFWSQQHLYSNIPATGGPKYVLFKRLVDYTATNALPCNIANNGGNITKPLGCYWLNASELLVNKNSDVSPVVFK
jgi:hypothetical protein